MPAELDIVGPGHLAFAEERDQFVRRTVEAAHGAGFLVTDDQIDEVEPGGETSRVEAVDRSPIHEGENNAAFDERCR